MSHTSLAPLLDFVLAHRPASAPLIADRAELQTLAHRLPALPCAGLELRLAPGSATVADLQLGIYNPTDLRHLRDWLQPHWPDASQPLPDDWAALRRALDDGLVDIPMRELWLELDGGSDNPWPPLSLFISLDMAPGCPQLGPQLMAWLDRLDAAPSQALMDGVQRCLAACQGPQRLTHLGWMPGRPGSALRLIIEGCTWDTDAEFLARAGWPGDPDAWRDTLLPLQADIDRWRLAIGLREDGSIAPVVGLECLLGQPSAHDARWPRLLDQGMRQGWWSAQAVDALREWPGPLTPAAARAPWPDALLLEAVIDGDDPPAALNLRISHVKLLSDGHTLGGAKGYVGFARVRPTELQHPGPPAPPRADPVTSAPIAAERGLHFLLKSRTPSGWWQDYDGFSEGLSDEWVTAFVAKAVLASRLRSGHRAASRAWSLLAARGRKGWGWNAVQPPDADSTAWALRLAFALGHHQDEAAQNGLAFLADHLICDGAAAGGVATYERRHHAAAGGDPACQPNWFSPHDCVTAAVACLAVAEGRTTLRSTIGYLQRHQQPDGGWSSYWWADPAYATACATEALADDPDPASREACRRAAAWARRSLAANPLQCLSPFALALRLQVLRRALEPTDGAVIAQGCHRLLATQWPDGSWPGDAALAIPNRHGQIVPALDNRRTMTTAVVVQTLALLPTPALQ